MSLSYINQVVAVVPAAGVGKRMASHIPKQYLPLLGLPILQHTLAKLLAVPTIKHIVLVVSAGDEYLASELAAFLVENKAVISVTYGGAERVDSVLAGLKKAKALALSNWVLVHDAARPCVPIADIENLIQSCLQKQQGAILAVAVRDTMKRTCVDNTQLIKCTVDRENLWHALTPQMFKVDELIAAIEFGLEKAIAITDEASAIEAHRGMVNIVAANPCNIKVTQAEDMLLAAFYLQQEAAMQQNLTDI